MENQIKEKFLPIGTVVLLKGGKKELMITSYCIFPAGEVYDKNGPVKDANERMFDYGACVYPEGMVTSDQLFAFDHNQIEKIVYMGYETDKQKDISKILLTAIAERERLKNADISDLANEIRENKPEENPTEN